MVVGDSRNTKNWVSRIMIRSLTWIVFLCVLLPIHGYAQQQYVTEDNSQKLAEIKPKVADAVAYCENSKNGRNEFWGNDQVFCLYGDITRNFSKSLKNYNVPKNSIVVVDSIGGYSTQAIEIANILLKKEIVIIVKDRCLSACANYIFVSAKYKYIFPGASIGWHGAFSNSVRIGSSQELVDEIYAGWKSQTEFFDKIGVNQALIRGPPPTMTENPTRAKDGSRIPNVYWSYKSD